jgi:hypothetical protein
MALAFLNRCGFRATSTGTGSFVVASALTGMQTPAQCAGPAVVDGATYRYFAQSDDLTQWEYGTGVYTTGDVTLTRATVYDNSSGGTTALSFSAAPRVYMGGPLAQDMSGRWEVIGDTTVGSPVASVVHTFDPDDYFDVLRCTVTDAEIDDAATTGTAYVITIVSLQGEDVSGVNQASGGYPKLAAGDADPAVVISSAFEIDMFLTMGAGLQRTANAIDSNDGGAVFTSNGGLFDGTAQTPVSGNLSVTYTGRDLADDAQDLTAGRYVTMGIRR